MAITSDRIVKQNEMSIINFEIYEFYSFFIGYQLQELWTPAEREEFTTIMEPGDVADKFAGAVMKKKVLVGSPSKGKTGRLAKAIFYVLRSCYSDSGCVKVTDEAITIIN